MNIKHNEKTYRVSKDEWSKYLKTSMKDLEYDTIEDWNEKEIVENAKQIWLEDNALEVNEEQEKLEKNKVKVKLDAKDTSKTRKKTTREKKKDDVKEMIIAAVAQSLQGLGCEVEITNVSKTIEFKFNEESYAIDLKRHRKKK